jgi:hypothetical protein
MTQIGDVSIPDHDQQCQAEAEAKNKWQRMVEAAKVSHQVTEHRYFVMGTAIVGLVLTEPTGDTELRFSA